MWEIPMETLIDVRGNACAMADGCYYDDDIDSIKKNFKKNFLDHYNKEKTPFPMFFHAAWFHLQPKRLKAFLQFVDSILALPDVYFVTSQELIQWVKHPKPLNAMGNFFRC